jgi:hypothetical protein
LIGFADPDARQISATESADSPATSSTPVPALLQTQSHVADLTGAYDQLAALVPGKPHAGSHPPFGTKTKSSRR